MSERHKHPGRKEILIAARTGKVPFRKHLQECESCRILFALLSELGDDGKMPVALPPDDHINRAQAIPRLVASRHPRRSVKGITVFDSWAERPRLAVRDVAYGVERRMRFAASGYQLDLVGTRHVAAWDFVARVYRGQTTTREFILQVGSRKLVTGRGDCFFFQSQHPPRKLQLLSADLRIDMGALQW